MRLQRLGASFPTRVSFLRTLLRRMTASGVVVERPVWNVGEDGYGHAVYSVLFYGYTYSLVAFSTPLADDQRSDRVIAEAWDTSYVLFDGIPNEMEIREIQKNAPIQERGRFDEKILILSRANKSVRFFEHVVDRLSRGLQPDPTRLREVGYLVRTTAVYGNGKFGIADRSVFADREGLSGPFMAEMMTVWLIREFSQDLAEHLAAVRSPGSAVTLDPNIRREFGVGNSTGLGMAPFLVNHPTLLNNWISARENALDLVTAKRSLSTDERARFRRLQKHAQDHLQQWHVDDQALAGRIATLRDEWAATSMWYDVLETDNYPVRRMLERARGLSLDFQELLVALMIETADDSFDDLIETMSSMHEPRLNPGMSVQELRQLISENYGWALGIRFDRPEEVAQFWYVSEEKLEPRLGMRQSEAGSELELPVDIARQVQALASALKDRTSTETIGEFLSNRPEMRHTVRRVQVSASTPYGEIRDNLLSDRCLPIDMLRSKLAFFGASKFDPRSDRWTRITLFQGAPSAWEISSGETDNCWLPVLS